MKREILYSISTILCGTFWEVLIMVMYATGYCTTFDLDWNNHRLSRYAFIVLVAFWRDFHFWWAHRLIHDWDTTYIPDLGKWLYKNAHYVHHQSRNSQPWSGISMHPIEGLIYETAVFVPLFFFHHPILINFIKIDLNYSAVLGHDGHEYPGHGDWFHAIHHMKVKNNYGTANAPFDWLFGTVDLGEDLDNMSDQTDKYQKMLENEAQATSKKET